MSKKTLKREAKAIWDGLRHDRRDRAKLVSAEDLAASADLIAAHAAALKELSKRAEAEAAKASATPAKPSKEAKPKRKAKKAKTES